ncbi:MAG: DUF445 domain-containing protein [Acidimicrobiia bacterium]|nr:DUF445 domain-containing protein [Acidimicrobiia bacterium]
MTAPPASSAADLYRAQDLRRMKVFATSLLVVAAVVYVVARTLGDRTGLLGAVEATAEAAMVGALADWFAVTALFRHPLGIPIPHTAIIPTRKDAIGVSLGEFVRHNFLDHAVLAERVRSVEPSRRIAAWLGEAEHRRSVTRQLGAVVRAGSEVLDDPAVRQGFESVVVGRIEQTPVAPTAGRVLEFAIEGGHHQAVLEAGLRAVRGILRDNEAVMRQQLGEESPWWVPEPLDDRVFDRLFVGITGFLTELADNRDHPLRRSVDERAAEFARQLRTSPEMRAKADELKAELLDHPRLREWTNDLWTSITAAVVDAADEPDSELRRRIEDALEAASHRLATDPELAARVDEWLVSATQYVADQAGDEVAELISSTVARWDAADTSRRIELQVGRDLQFIRINGTVVGGLAGLVIYLVSHLLG